MLKVEIFPLLLLFPLWNVADVMNESVNDTFSTPPLPPTVMCLIVSGGSQ